MYLLLTLVLCLMAAPTEAESLVKQLGGEKHSEREEAEFALMFLGVDAHAPLEKHTLLTTDLEITTRAVRILNFVPPSIHTLPNKITLTSGKTQTFTWDDVLKYHKLAKAKINNHHYLYSEATCLLVQDLRKKGMDKKDILLIIAAMKKADGRVQFKGKDGLFETVP